MVIPVRYVPSSSDDIITSDKEDDYLMTKRLEARVISDHLRNVDVYLINSDKEIYIIKNHPHTFAYPRSFGPATGFVQLEDFEDIEDKEICYLNAAKRVLEKHLGIEVSEGMLNLVHRIPPSKNYRKDWYGVVTAKSDLTPLPHPMYTIPSRCDFYTLTELEQLISRRPCADTMKYGFDFKRSKRIIRTELEKLVR